MNNLFNRITEENKLTLNKGGDIDALYYSELNEWFTGNAFRSFSLKYVVDKCIYYKAGSTEHIVKNDSFLLACRQPHVKAYFESKEIVKSVCIDISSATVAEAFTIMSAREDHDFDNYLSKYFRYPEFFESVCPVNNSVFQGKLGSLLKMIHENDTDEIDREWFLDLTEKIIYHSYGNFLALNNIESVKLETRKELLKRLYSGRDYIDENFLSIDSIGEVAIASNMSEFHFFRSFRQAFGTTPYQHILTRKLEFATSMLKQPGVPVSEVATACNFSDLFTFSKAFKRRFGVSPSQYQAANI